MLGSAIGAISATLSPGSLDCLNGPMNLSLRTISPGQSYQLLKRGRPVMDAAYCGIEGCWLWASGREAEEFTPLERSAARQMVRDAAREWRRRYPA